MSVTETGFEEHIASWLVDRGGYRQTKIGDVGDGPRDFDAQAGIDTVETHLAGSCASTGSCLS